MLKRIILVVAVIAIALGGSALVAPAPQARPCVLCPDIVIDECAPCYQLVPRTCEHCAYCAKIKGCHP